MKPNLAETPWANLLIAMKEIIDYARQNIKQELRWAYPIALKLYKDSYDLPIAWAVECLQIYSSEFKPSNINRLNKYIVRALDRDYRDALTSLQCKEIANELWYSPERDDFQTAIARLWWAISDKQDRVIEAEMCVSLLLPALSNSLLLDRYLEAAIIIHEEHKAC